MKSNSSPKASMTVHARFSARGRPWWWKPSKIAGAGAADGSRAEKSIGCVAGAPLAGTA